MTWKAPIEVVRAYNRAYYLKNSGKIKDSARRYHWDNHEQVKAKMRLRSKLNAKERSLKSKLYRAENGDEIEARRRQKRKDNPEAVRAKARAYHAANRDHRNELIKSYVRRNRAKVSARQLRWTRMMLKKFPERFREYRSRRQAREHGGSLGNPEAIRQFYKWIRSAVLIHCHWCGGKIPKGKRAADHYIPLFRGGDHDVKNLVPSCKTCNSQKRDKMPEKFVAWRVKLGLAADGVGSIRLKGKAKPNLP